MVVEDNLACCLVIPLQVANSRYIWIIEEVGIHVKVSVHAIQDIRDQTVKQVSVLRRIKQANLACYILVQISVT